MKRLAILLIVLIALTAVGCSMANLAFSPHASLVGGPEYVLVAALGSSPTPTPFQPIPPTPTYIPTSVIPAASATPEPLPASPTPTSTPQIVFVADKGRSWQDYPGPSVWPDIDVPPPVGILSHPEDQVNILLLGSDQRPSDSGFRTDTIQLLTINPTEKTVKLTAFPRDLYVYIPGYTVQRINTAMGWGGFEALAQTMEYNFGVRPDYYVLINFWSFVDVIDSIGGIRVDIGRDFCDHRDAFGWYCVSSSEMWMDGESALWYVRARYSTSDLDRGRRQQEVLDAVFDKLMSLNWLQNAPELYETYKNNVTTNLDLDTLTRFFPVAYNVAETHAIESHSIGSGQVYNWTTTSGAMVLVPVRDQVLAVMRQAISEP